MRKKVFGKQLGRNKNSRKALFRALLSSFFKHGKIVTTRAKVDAILPDIDGMVNLAKVGSTASLRKLFADLGNDKESVKNLVAAAPKLGDRNSGYTRMIRLGARQGDNAEMARIEWVVDVTEKPKAKTEKVKKTK